jgi:hypothetical protein
MPISLEGFIVPNRFKQSSYRTSRWLPNQKSVSTISPWEMPEYNSQDPGLANIASPYTEQAVAAATSFTCFLKIQLNVQRNFWKFACFIPRAPARQERQYSLLVSWFSHIDIPDVLHVIHSLSCILDFYMPSCAFSFLRSQLVPSCNLLTRTIGLPRSSQRRPQILLPRFWYSYHINFSSQRFIPLHRSISVGSAISSTARTRRLLRL